MNKLTEILGKLQDTSTSPGELSEFLLYFSAEYAKRSVVGNVIVANRVKWNELHRNPTFTTDRQVDKFLEATPEGQLETVLRLELKSLERLMGAIKSHLRIREVEARNQF